MAQQVAEKQRAKVRDVEYIPFDSNFSGYCTGSFDSEFVQCICIAHPNAGKNGIALGGVIHTTKVLIQHDNGDFETLNTYYEVEKP